MLATCATPPTFNPVVVSKDFATFEYVSGDVGLSNPIREVIAEAQRAYGDEATVACLLSIGCGHPGVIKVPKDSGSALRLEFLERLAMDSETTAREMEAQMNHLSLYHRFSVIYGMELSQDLRWKEPEVISVHTAAYLADVEVGEAVERCVDIINDGDGFTTLEQLSKHFLIVLHSPLMFLSKVWWLQDLAAASSIIDDIHTTFYCFADFYICKVRSGVDTNDFWLLPA